MTADSRCDHSSSIANIRTPTRGVLYCRWAAGLLCRRFNENKRRSCLSDAEYFYRHGLLEPSTSTAIRKATFCSRTTFLGALSSERSPLRQAVGRFSSGNAYVSGCRLGRRSTFNFGTEAFLAQCLRRVNPNAHQHVTDKFVG